MGFCPSGLLSQWAFVRSPVTRAGIHKLHVRIANMDDPDHTASEEAPNFRISTVHAVLHQNISDGICS